MRLREEQLVRNLIRTLAEGGTLDDTALTDAGMTVYRFGNMGDEAARKHALERAKRAMLNPDVQARFADLFEINGFSINDAIVAQIAFIKDGNYRALQDYFRMTQPPIPKTALVAHVDASAFTSREPRAIVARVLAAPTYESVVADEEEAQSADDAALADESPDVHDDRPSAADCNGAATNR
jgi:hypothetical protein